MSRGKYSSFLSIIPFTTNIQKIAGSALFFSHLLVMSVFMFTYPSHEKHYSTAVRCMDAFRPSLDALFFVSMLSHCECYAHFSSCSWIVIAQYNFNHMREWIFNGYHWSVNNFYSKKQIFRNQIDDIVEHRCQRNALVWAHASCVWNVIDICIEKSMDLVVLEWEDINWYIQHLSRKSMIAGDIYVTVTATNRKLIQFIIPPGGDLCQSLFLAIQRNR